MTNMHVKHNQYVSYKIGWFKVNPPDCPENPSTGYAD